MVKHTQTIRPQRQIQNVSVLYYINFYNYVKVAEFIYKVTEPNNQVRAIKEQRIFWEIFLFQH